MSSVRILFLAIILIWLIPVAAFSQRSYQTARLSGPAPQIDGIINDASWESVSWGDSFTQREPYDGKSPSQQTAFRILYDDKFVYVAIRAFDSVPSDIVTRLTRRDNTDADWVGIIFDSYNDNLTGFGFAVTASGVKMDLMIINDGQDDESWDAIWNAKSHIDAQGWTAEFSIPLSQLRFSGKDEMTWGLNVMRYIYRKEEMSVWQPIARNAPGFVSLFGDLQGLKGIKPKREVEILPYMVTKAQYDEKEEGNPFATGKSYGFNTGIDGKIGLTNDFTLNFTVNPDFGQVEADPSEVNLTAFESYFEEKRPFFIEGKNIFDFRLTGGDGDDTQNNMFYSRRIGREPHYYPETADGEYMKMPSTSHILGSFKVSGKSRKGLSVGILESLTGVEKAKFDLSGNRREMTVEPFTNYFVGRVMQDFNKGVSSLGGIFTSTNRSISVDYLKDLPSAAYTGGLDYTHSWKNKTYYYSLKMVGTRLSGDTKAITTLQESSAHYYQSPDKKHVRIDTTATSLSGYAGTFEIGKQGNGHFNFMTWLTMRSPGVDFNDIGFMRQADEIQHVFWLGYRKYEPVGIFKSFGLNFNE
ncbi:MAG: carbohydrate binding family 9 domain-containing protein [Bacteroidales bacterium]|nr:carbohydrate binding family 9 domain-containing protein [Bacteroidales bacterium]